MGFMAGDEAHFIIRALVLKVDTPDYVLWLLAQYQNTLIDSVSFFFIKFFLLKIFDRITG